MSHTLTAEQKKLAEIFSDAFVFSIPGYQRPYAWGTEQAQELLEDLLSALHDAPEALNESAPYFLGSIVLIKRPDTPDATVVDGQQRLTTLTLLLSAIRATVTDPEVQSDITDCIYQKAKVIQNLPPRYLLTLRDKDRDFFRNYIQHEGGLAQLLDLKASLPDAQARLKANAELFLARLQDLDAKTLVRLVQFVITRCVLVTASTPDLDSAFRIFGVLNSCGLDLSATDILKADITSGIKDAERDAYTLKWEDLEEILGREAFGELFSHIRMVFRKAKPKGTLLKEFRDHVPATKTPQVFMDQVLLPMAHAFITMREESYAATQHAEAVNQTLSWLNRLEFTDWVPPAMACFVRLYNQPAQLLSFLRDLERLAYAMLARRVGVNERIERFSALTSAIERGSNLTDVESPLQLTQLEQHETYQALNGPLYQTHSARSLAVLLLRLDHLLSDASVTFKPEIVSVEHVMPQQPAPRSQWFQWVPEPKAHQHWVHRIGNLALLSRSKNSAAGNYEFDKKKVAYFSKGGVCLFALTTQVLQHTEWTEPVIRARQQALMDKLSAHWRLNDRQSPEEQTAALLAELSGGGSGLVFELKSTKLGLYARARVNGSQLLVLAGSLARRDWIGLPGGYQPLWQELVASGQLPLTDDALRRVFAKDTLFSSASAASATILGRADNGPASWKVQGTQLSFGAWLENPATFLGHNRERAI